MMSGATGYGNGTAAMISAPTCGWMRIFWNSSCVKGPGFDLPVKQLREANEAFFKDWMDSAGGLDPSDLSGN